MAIYRTAPTKTLKLGDTVIIEHKGITYTLTVHSDHISTPGSCNRAVLGAIFGVSDEKLNKRVGDLYGYHDTVGNGWWPYCRAGDFAALTRVVRALFKKCRKPSKAQLAKLAAAEKREAAAQKKAEADAAAARAHLPKPAQDFLGYLDKNPSAFGCQRAHVIATVGAILGVDLTPAI